MTTALITLTNKLATTLNMGDGTGLIDTLKATCFKGTTQVTDAQMTALMVVANQYGLNPWTKEIYAFPDKGGIVPVVGVDGWSRIINSNPQFDGMDFEQDADSCTCTIYRKDRKHPTKLTEWMAECKRDGVGPWKSHPYRMLRHKAMIQCARVAFGFGGIYDTDEAERIVEAKQINPATGEIITQSHIDSAVIEEARTAAGGGVATYSAWWTGASKETRVAVGADEHNRLKAVAAAADKARTVNGGPATDAQIKKPGKTFDEVMTMICNAPNADDLQAIGPLIDRLPVEAQTILNAKYDEQLNSFGVAA